MSANNVPCLHPREHGVKFHRADTQAARDCASGKSFANVAGRGINVPPPSMRETARLSNAIGDHEITIRKGENGDYVVTTEFQVVARDEETALELAEASYPELEDSGVSATRADGNTWDVVTQFSVQTPDMQGAQEFVRDQFAGTPNFRNFLAAVERVQD